MNTKKFIVRLSDEERQKLQSIVKKLKGTSQTVKRAIALLKADADGANWTNEKIRELTGLSLPSTSNIRKQLVLEGFEVTLNRKQRRLPRAVRHVKLADIKTAFMHGHDQRRFNRKTSSSQWDMLCSGHTHKSAHWMACGQTIVLYPGAFHRMAKPTNPVVQLPERNVTLK